MIYNIAKQNFDKMLMGNISGQNWNCSLIEDISTRKNPARIHLTETRCTCFKKAGEKNLIMRTSKNNPLKFGMLVYIKEQDKFYLLKEQPVEQIDCYAVVPTLCTHILDFYVNVPDTVDENGFLIENGYPALIAESIPCEVTRRNSFVTGTGIPGIANEEELILALQLNETLDIRAHDWFKLDGKTYEVFDRYTEGNTESGGILYLTCKRVVGSDEK